MTPVDAIQLRDRTSFHYGDEFSTTDGARNGGTEITCVPAPGATSITFPEWALSALTWAPAAGAFDASASLRNDVVVSLVSRTRESFEASGLDAGLIDYSHIEEVAIPFAGPFSPTTPVTGPSGETVLAELAVTDFERSRALAGRSQLPEGRGLLMQFGEDMEPTFSTAELPAAVDLAWLDEAGEALEVQRVAVCEDECAPILGPGGSRWVLAIPAGEAERLQISKGSALNW